ncbi:MAG TPA: anion transporter [Verrucomicrobiae bacterium]|nr:anion transporter [Verrucomicrobiae bacterium]
MTAETVFCAGVVLATLIGVALGRYPALRMNRATIAFVGAVVLLLGGAVRREDAWRLIDWDTIALLFAMMVINANFRLSGFFHLVGSWVARHAKTPRRLLALIVFCAGVLSALFLNDTIVLMFTPLVLDMTLAMRRNPVPYLIGLVCAANIGSVATITGNPQNMIVGMASGIPFAHFTLALAPVAILGLGLAWLIIVALHRQEFAAGPLDTSFPIPDRHYRPLLRKSLLAAGAMLVAFLAGAPIAMSALGAAAVLLVTRRLKPARVFREIDWSLLVFFASLFVVTGSLQVKGLSDRLFAFSKPWVEGGLPAFCAVAVVLSNVVSNVPAVMLFRHLILALPDPRSAWLALAAATTLAGNLTLLGSVANLIVAEIARARGVRLGFVAYLRAGVPITLATLAVAILWLSVLR